MRLVEIYRCLSDETRVRMLHLLAQTPLCVCHLQSILNLDQVATSKHLAYLRERGLVEGRRHQHWIIYSLPEQPPVQFTLQLRCLQECAAGNETFRGDLQRLENLESECCWVPEVLAGLASTKPRQNSKEPAPQYA